LDYDDIYDDIWHAPVPDLSIASDVLIEYFDENESISPTIPTVVNMTTGKRIKSTEDVRRIVKDGNFFQKYVNYPPENANIEGFLIQYNEKRDVLVIYEGKFKISRAMNEHRKNVLKGTWMDVKPEFVITKEADIYENRLHTHIYARYADYVDMLETTIVYDNSRGAVLVHSTEKSENILKEFFGQESLPLADTGSAYRCFSTLGSKNSLNMLLKEKTIAIPEEVGARYADIAKPYKWLKLPDVDKEKIFHVIQWDPFGDNAIENGTLHLNNQTRTNELKAKDFRLGFIQKVEDNVCVLRIFDTYFSVAKAYATLEITTSDIKMYEAVRIFFSMEEICACRNYFGKWEPYPLEEANGHFLNKIILIPWDKGEVQGTILSCLDDGTYDEWFHQISSNTLEYRETDMKARSGNVLSLLTSKYAKDIYTSPFTAIQKCFKNNLKYRNIQSILVAFLDVYGEYQDSLMNALNFPKRFMNAYENVLEKYQQINRDGEQYIKRAEESLITINMFLHEASDDERDFANGINTEQYQDLLETWVTSNQEIGDAEFYIMDLAYCIRSLVSLCGVKNLKKYIEYVYRDLPKLNDENDDEFFGSKALFVDYIRMCSRLKQRGTLTGKPFWKFRRFSDLRTAHDEVLLLENLQKEEALASKEEKYSELKKKYEDYKYSEDSFSVVYPENLKAIINEGITLNHCVKSYIDAVLEETTNILFVRRSNNLNEPFYTLEVKDKRVRQCHGKFNCNVSETEGLQEFLERYCKDKDIKIGNADMILAVE
jgi:hypothetical protein